MSAIFKKAADWWAGARANPLFWKGLVGAGVIAGLDQLSKFWIVHVIELPERLRPCVRAPENLCGQIAVSPIFDLTFVRNFGASFGMLQGSRILLSLLSLSIAAALVIWLGKLTRPVAAIGVALVVGGALGNLYDRIMLGYVVDFLDFSGLMFPWVFNIADAAINVGVAFLLLDAWQTREKLADEVK